MTTKEYFIVNPTGTVHSVSKEHAAKRLRSPGWVMASEDEINTYHLVSRQTWDHPFAQVHTVDPDEAVKRVPKTRKARTPSPKTLKKSKRKNKKSKKAALVSAEE